MRASAAWMLPACLCSRPDFARMKTSNSGHSFRTSLIGRSSSGCRRCRLSLACVRDGRVADPGAFLVRAATGLETLAVARTVPLEHTLELRPVDLAEVVVLCRLVPAQLRIGNRDAEEFGLRRRD